MKGGGYVVDSITGASVRELVPVDRFEWERIVRRVEMPSTAKFLGLTMATYAEADGSRIWPGVDRLAAVMCVSVPTVKRNLAVLRKLGLVEVHRRGRRSGLADEYRLTMPSDILDLPMLDPSDTPSSADHE